ncbi:hypothetical protein F0562_015459 [Nyssa sinensis]|uniref:Uncharacterized protein n=1 Tax=Nyssa sinensis TaxID=561372 RepID=A0A5J4ZHG0_9ASTE|nr:hypothetical protein F0562_015459 [Nyssa sinensis]
MTKPRPIGLLFHQLHIQFCPHLSAGFSYISFCVRTAVAALCVVDEALYLSTGFSAKLSHIQLRRRMPAF